MSGSWASFLQKEEAFGQVCHDQVCPTNYLSVDSARFVSHRVCLYIVHFSIPLLFSTSTEIQEAGVKGLFNISPR